MTYLLETASALENPAEIEEIILEFYTGQVKRLLEGGGPKLSPQRPASGFWSDVDNYFPPKGALLLARADQGHLTGIGAMTDIGGGIAEMKYLYVRPEARDTGLGRKLVTERIDLARQMGLSRICVDTLEVSVEMHRLYEDLGFERVAEFAESKSIRDMAELKPFMRFYQMQL